MYIKIKEVANCEQNAMFMAPASTEEESIDKDEKHGIGNLEHNQQRYLFHSSQLVKRAIQMSPQLNLPNLPLATEKIVSFELFNFVAWVTDACCEPVSASEKKFVKLDNDSDRRTV